MSSALTRWRTTPFPVADPVWNDASPNAAYERVLAEFGATPWDRDEVDQLLHDQVVSRTGSIISHENQLVPLGVSNGGFGTLGGVAAPLDTDRDGMPDEWEIKYGLLPNRPSNNGDFDADGFSDLEEYLNDLAAFKAPGPVEYVGGPGGRDGVRAGDEGDAAGAPDLRAVGCPDDRVVAVQRTPGDEHDARGALRLCERSAKRRRGDGEVALDGGCLDGVVRLGELLLDGVCPAAEHRQRRHRCTHGGGPQCEANG